MLIDRIPASSVAIEPVDSPPLVDVDVHQEPDDYYAHPELDPLFTDMFLAEGIPFPDPEPEVPVIDADLYEQPFAIASPSPQIDLNDPVSPQSDSITPVSEIVPSVYPVHVVPPDSLIVTTPESHPSQTKYPSHLLEVHLCQESPPPANEGTSSSRIPRVNQSFRYEPELVEPVGKGKVQYLPVSAMSFITDLYILHPEWKVISHDRNPHVPQPLEPEYREDELEPLRSARPREATREWEDKIDRYLSDVTPSGSEEDEPDPSGSNWQWVPDKNPP